jgi:hypothetical protein
MATVRKLSIRARRVPNARIIMVSVGIALFVIGFLVTVDSFSQVNIGGTRNGADAPLSGNSGNLGGEADVIVIAGIMTSLAVVVIATVGPAVSVMRGRDRAV